MNNLTFGMERSVENKIVVVTGGAQGIGLETVSKFIENGARVGIILDCNEQLGVEAAKDLSKKYGPGKAVFIRCDVTTDLEATFEKIINEYKVVDVLINNAGIINESSIREIIEVNTIALMEWTSKFYEFMRKDRDGSGGTIINISSVFGFRTIPHSPCYQASKFAIIGFSKSMGHNYNYNKTGVRVVVMCPGFTYTQLLYKKPKDDDSMPDAFQYLKTYEFQEVDAVGRGLIKMFKEADSGTVWLVEGSRSALRL